jgi:hypothetical protein
MVDVALIGDSIVCVFISLRPPLATRRILVKGCEKRRRVFPGFLFRIVVGHLVLGLASGLEAFSREPPWDSIGALAVRQTPETRATAWEMKTILSRSRMCGQVSPQ